jgi:hypothetical protein
MDAMTDRMTSMDPRELLEAAGAMKDQLGELVQQASERLEIERRVRENPWMVLGIAAGAGFILGGGLWPAVRPLVKSAGRAALSPSNLLAIAAAVGAMRAAGAQEEDEMGTEPETPTAH